MKKIFYAIIAVLMLSLVTNEVKAQTQTPGLDVLGFGYDVFGQYADQSSTKEFCLFTYSGFTNKPIGSNTYSVPKLVQLKNISKHITKTVSGSSLREYSKSLSAEVGLSVDAMFFSGSINSSYSQSSSGQTAHYYFTYMDANTKWRVSLDNRNIEALKAMLDPQFKKDLNNPNVSPANLFETYGTHYVASAYLGGRADYTSVSDVSQNTNTQDIAVAVEAEYKAVSGNSKLSKSQSETLKNAKTTTKLVVTGGNSEFANDISDPVTYEKWASGIATMPVLCDFDKNSLRPIWELCNSSTRKAQLKAEFAKMLKKHPLPAAMSGALRVRNKVFFIASEADGLYIDIPGYHFDAQRKNGTKVSIFPKDNREAGLQGIDRFIKVIPHATEPDYVFLQPQHSDLVLDVRGGSKNAGTKIQLWNVGNNNVAQMFKLIVVDGKSNTYYIQNKNSGLYLTSHGKNQQLTQEKITKAKNQQWKFEPARAEDMASMRTNLAFAFKNVAANRYMDLAGTGASAKTKDSHIILWDMDYFPDRYAQLFKSNIDNYYYVQQMHSKYVWDIESGEKTNGAKLQLWDKNSKEGQLFRFIYAGSAMTFKIENRGSKKYLDANNSAISQNGCPIQIWDGNGQKNQLWKLEPLKEWYAPEKPVKVKIKVAFSNKYLDIEGSGANAKVNGKKLQIWDMDNGADRFFTIKRSGDHSWIWFELNGGKHIDVWHEQVNVNKTPLQVWDAHNGKSQKFAIHPTGRYTCMIVSQGWKALTVRDSKISENGSDIILWNQHYGSSQQFQLINTATGKPIDFSE